MTITEAPPREPTARELWDADRKLARELNEAAIAHERRIPELERELEELRAEVPMLREAARILHRPGRAPRDVAARVADPVDKRTHEPSTAHES